MFISIQLEAALKEVKAVHSVNSAFPTELWNRLNKLVKDKVLLNNIGGVANSEAYKAFRRGVRYHPLHATSTAKYFPKLEKIFQRVMYANELKAFHLMFEFFLQRAERESKPKGK